jgi:hypothetical protein
MLNKVAMYAQKCFINFFKEEKCKQSSISTSIQSANSLYILLHQLQTELQELKTVHVYGNLILLWNLEKIPN